MSTPLGTEEVLVFHRCYILDIHFVVRLVSGSLGYGGLCNTGLCGPHCWGNSGFRVSAGKRGDAHIDSGTTFMGRERNGDSWKGAWRTNILSASCIYVSEFPRL